MVRVLLGLIGILLLVSSASAQLVVAPGGDPPAAVTCGLTTGNCVGVGGGSSLFTAATCNGSADDATAIESAHQWALTWQGSHSGLIEFDIPHGGNCVFTTSHCTVVSSNCPGNAIKQFRLVGLGYTGNGDGATLTDNGGGVALGSWGDGGQGNTGGICNRGIWETAGGSTSLDGCDARFATVRAGASCVTIIAGDSTLSVATLAARFTVGRWAVFGGFAVQSAGSPPNNYFYEFHQITSVNTSTGQLCFTGSLAHGYKSTWYNYFIGNSTSGTPDTGGPGTVWQLPVAWDTQQEFRGLTFSMGIQSVIGRSITFTNFAAPNCLQPSTNVSFMMNTGTLGACNVEIDKFVGTYNLTNVTQNVAGILKFQSPSPDLFALNNSSIATITGLGKRFFGNGSTITSFSPGAYVYAFSTETDCTNCTIGTMLAAQNTADTFTSKQYTMSGGVVTIPIPVNVTAESAGTGGVVRLTVSCQANTSSSSLCTTPTAAWTTGQSAYVVGGASDVPGALYTLTVIDGTHVDLQGTTRTSGSPTASAQMGPFEWVGGAGNLQWLTPGANIYWFGGGMGGPDLPISQVTDVTYDGNSLHVTLSCSIGTCSGFPPVPNNGDLRINWQSSVAQTFTNTTVGGAAYPWPTPGASQCSYDQHVVTGANSGYAPPAACPYGQITSLTINVTQAYSGSTGTLTFGIGGAFGSQVADTGGANWVQWNPQVNAKVTGSRVISFSGGSYSVTCNGSAGACSGDTNMTPPYSPTWLLGSQVMEQFSSVPADIGATSVTVTIQTNTGAVVPVQ